MQVCIGELERATFDVHVCFNLGSFVHPLGPRVERGSVSPPVGEAVTDSGKPEDAAGYLRRAQ